MKNNNMPISLKNVLDEPIKKELKSRPLSACLFFFRLCHEARTALVTQPGIEPVPPAVEGRSLNHWTMRNRNVPSTCLLNVLCDKSGVPRLFQRKAIVPLFELQAKLVLFPLT